MQKRFTPTKATIRNSKRYPFQLYHYYSRLKSTANSGFFYIDPWKKLNSRTIPKLRKNSSFGQISKEFANFQEYPLICHFYQQIFSIKGRCLILVRNGIDFLPRTITTYFKYNVYVIGILTITWAPFSSACFCLI